MVSRNRAPSARGPRRGNLTFIRADPREFRAERIRVRGYPSGP